jgi:hypothetical protein
MASTETLRLYISVAGWDDPAAAAMAGQRIGRAIGVARDLADSPSNRILAGHIF